MNTERLRPWASSTIMVVDDHEPNVVLLTRLLQAAGMTRVDGYSDPRHALRAFEAKQPDLVLLDLHMPHIDGFGLMDAMLHRIAADDFLPIIVVTADGTPAARERALSVGAKDFLTKPYDTTEVVLRVANLLQSRELHNGLRQHNAALAAELKARDDSPDQATRMLTRRERVSRAFEPGALRTVFQPIANLRTGAVVGVEALSRFKSEVLATPDLWFDEARSVGLGRPLEMAAIRSALSHVDSLPPDVFISVNLSPDAVFDPTLREQIPPAIMRRLVIEITEHSRTANYRALVDVLDSLRADGVRIAVDDTGAGFAGLKQILEIAPQIIKLDLALTRRIDRDPVRRSLTRCLLAFANEIDAVIVAEGIESPEEFTTLRDLGVTLGQGYFLARPAAASDTATLSRAALDLG
jgi:EAL domain-containing protein (putative c-di-GMP-specific phosphodiesterase class I)/ActR/RegA family two-component response regulator